MKHRRRFLRVARGRRPIATTATTTDRNAIHAIAAQATHAVQAAQAAAAQAQAVQATQTAAVQNVQQQLTASSSELQRLREKTNKNSEDILTLLRQQNCLQNLHLEQSVELVSVRKDLQFADFKTLTAATQKLAIEQQEFRTAISTVIGETKGLQNLLVEQQKTVSKVLLEMHREREDKFKLLSKMRSTLDSSPEFDSTTSAGGGSSAAAASAASARDNVASIASVAGTVGATSLPGQVVDAIEFETSSVKSLASGVSGIHE